MSHNGHYNDSTCSNHMSGVFFEADSHIDTGTKNTQAGQPSSSVQNLSASSTRAAASTLPAKGSPSQKGSTAGSQTLADMPKHGKSTADDSVASPPKVKARESCRVQATCL